MGRRFKQFDAEARHTIARRHEAGESIRQIAAALDCAPSSVARELKRNGSRGGYKPVYAQQQARSRHWRGSRLERDPQLQAQVLNGLKQQWSPEQVSARLAQAGTCISYESIYRFIDAQIARTQDYSWRHYLPRAKSKRGRRGHKGGSPAEHIRDRVSIQQRPAAVQNRNRPGHWEADLMQFSRHGQVLLALHERTSRLTLVVRQPGKAAAPMAQTLTALLAPLPPSLRRTITFDNGTEFALHYLLQQQLGIRTYFCDPHAPWQKGGIENAIGRLRRLLPRKTDLAGLTTSQIQALALVYNHTPRKCLGYKTPAETFAKVLHLKCESTYRLSPV
jgi:IS30 family transposase